ncbi:hypothetical protein J6590_052134 [Homalodisca vitripennis]|nr:hypothetical protein J6590_052134 [Homalodisca vitripennis]
MAPTESDPPSMCPRASLRLESRDFTVCDRCTSYQYYRPCSVSTLPLIMFDKILAQASGP